MFSLQISAGDLFRSHQQSKSSKPNQSGSGEAPKRQVLPALGFSSTDDATSKSKSHPSKSSQSERADAASTRTDAAIARTDAGLTALPQKPISGETGVPTSDGSVYCSSARI